MDSRPHNAQRAGRILLFDAAPGRTGELAEGLRGHGLPVTNIELSQSSATRFLSGDVACVVLDPATPRASLAPLLVSLSDSQTPALVWGAAEPGPRRSGALLEYVAPSANAAEVVGRLASLVHVAPEMARLNEEMGRIERVSQQLTRYFSQIDEEMRLAGRLQRSFLPQVLPCAGPLRFAAVYRPASWVSGDLYDAFLIDPLHVGLLLADAMGHGTSAALVTMLVRQALTPTRIADNGLEVVSPAAAMTHLHERLARHALPGNQYVTGVYAIVNAQTLELRLARGGHPHPLLIRPGGAIEPIGAEGGLIGIPDLEADFEEASIQLAPGDKVALYTDGLDDDLAGEDSGPAPCDALRELLASLAHLPAQAVVEGVAAHLDGREGSLHPDDDVTLLVLEVLAEAPR